MSGLERFITAQDPVWSRVLAELDAGRKASHWMWFVFPQIAGLGHSPTAQFYAIADLAEAEAYLAHPILGPRLVDATARLLARADISPGIILGAIDALKFRSSMTLFAAVPDAPPVFDRALDAFYGGVPCPLTRARLGL